MCQLGRKRLQWYIIAQEALFIQNPCCLVPRRKRLHLCIIAQTYYGWDYPLGGFPHSRVWSWSLCFTYFFLFFFLARLEQSKHMPSCFWVVQLFLSISCVVRDIEMTSSVHTSQQMQQLQLVTTHGNTTWRQHYFSCSSAKTLQRSATRCSTTWGQLLALPLGKHSSTLQLSATCCNLVQHIAILLGSSNLGLARVGLLDLPVQQYATNGDTGVCVCVWEREKMRVWIFVHTYEIYISMHFYRYSPEHQIFMQHTATRYNTQSPGALYVHINIYITSHPNTKSSCNTRQHTATHGNTRQHTATHGNTQSPGANHRLRRHFLACCFL